MIVDYVYKIEWNNFYSTYDIKEKNAYNLDLKHSRMLPIKNTEDYVSK